MRLNENPLILMNADPVAFTHAIPNKQSSNDGVDSIVAVMRPNENF